MKKYEAMFIIKPDLSEEDRKALFSQLSDAVVKNNGNVLAGAVWAEKRKLFFPLKRYRDGLYYLMSFNLSPLSITSINRAYKLNENILRILITKLE